MHLNAHPGAEAKKRLDYSMGLPVHLPREPVAQDERIRRLLLELNIDNVAAADAAMHGLIATVIRWIGALAVDDNDIGNSTLIEHRIETGSSLPFKQKSRPIPSARRKFREEELQRLSFEIISVADPGVKHYVPPMRDVPKKGT